jgi:signal transduction histidine kinase
MTRGGIARARELRQNIPGSVETEPEATANGWAEVSERSLVEFFADELSRQSDELVEEWIEWLVEHLKLQPALGLPKDSIRDHMPQIVRGIAEFLRMPLRVVRYELMGHLRLHAQVRSEQGYGIEELIQEYEALNSIVSDRMIRAVAAFPGEADPVEVARLFATLREGLGTISTATLTLYHQKESEHKRELTKALQGFAETIAHEIKNPLNSILAGATMLEEPEVASRDEERRRFLHLIRRGVRRTEDLLEDLRILALAEGGTAGAQWRSLRKTVESVFAQLADLASKKNVRLLVDEPLPEITLDRSRTELALVNLVSNAIKYSDPDKEERWVRVGSRPAEEGENRWDIWVEDNGRGVPTSLQSQIFERHFRAHPDAADGSGLGLAIARKAVEQRGGRIWFESEPGKGSTFHMTMPALGDIG